MTDLPGALAPYGWGDRLVALFNDLDVDGAEPARVVRVERSACVVVGPDAVDRLVHAPVLPAVGDWVAVRRGVVAATVPRWSTLSRGDPHHGVQVLAANVDVVLITAPADRLSPARVERELLVAWDSGARPVVVMTKADMAPAGMAEELEDRLVGVDVVVTSAATGEGVDRVRDVLRPGLTAVLLGPSGAGKSSLANRLLGADVLATAAVRDADQRGRHTTTSRQLVCLPSGGVLIDTPGLRSLGLAGHGEEIDQVFDDIADLAVGCRFRDCAHQTEPGCAVLAAAADGELGAGRLDSYRKLERELAAEARRQDPVLRKAELSVWKARSKAVRAQYRLRGR